MYNTRVVIINLDVPKRVGKSSTYNINDIKYYIICNMYIIKITCTPFGRPLYY